MSAVTLSRPARVLRIEVRRSVVPWSVPLLLALFFFDSYRTAAGFPPIWTVHASAITNNLAWDFAPFAAGLGAWVASREGRRNTGDLLATTVRPAWARQAAALGATLFWLLLTFGVAVAALYIQVALQATWGGPPLWPVVVGAVQVVTLAVLGFTAGALFPGRFTAPLAAIGAFLLIFAGFHASLNLTPGSSMSALLSPATAAPLEDAGVFYHFAPDVAIAQVMFMGGIAVALLGVLVLAPVFRVRGGPFAAIGRTGRLLCAAGVVLLAAGVAASWTAFALTGTARLSVSGWDIPALHDAASDQPVPYTPDCAGTAFPVCLHPAFSAYLPAAAAALQPVAAELKGLPGAPVRAEEVPAAGEGMRATQGILLSGMPAPGVSGTPPVYRYDGNNGMAPFLGSPAGANWRAGFQQEFLTAFIAGPAHAGPGPDAGVLPPTAAQQAVITALTAKVGSQAQFGESITNGHPTAGATPAQIAAAAQRFASLAPAARHAWLAAHLPALRAGTITLAQLP
jgi:hypothetical protein